MSDDEVTREVHFYDLGLNYKELTTLVRRCRVTGAVVKQGRGEMIVTSAAGIPVGVIDAILDRVASTNPGAWAEYYPHDLSAKHARGEPVFRGVNPGLEAAVRSEEPESVPVRDAISLENPDGWIDVPRGGVRRKDVEAYYEGAMSVVKAAFGNCIRMSSRLTFRVDEIGDEGLLGLEEKVAEVVTEIERKYPSILERGWSKKFLDDIGEEGIYDQIVKKQLAELEGRSELRAYRDRIKLRHISKEVIGRGIHITSSKQHAIFGALLLALGNGDEYGSLAMWKYYGEALGVPRRTFDTAVQRLKTETDMIDVKGTSSKSVWYMTDTTRRT